MQKRRILLFCFYSTPHTLVASNSTGDFIQASLVCIISVEYAAKRTTSSEGISGVAQLEYLENVLVQWVDKRSLSLIPDTLIVEASTMLIQATDQAFACAG